MKNAIVEKLYLAAHESDARLTQLLEQKKAGLPVDDVEIEKTRVESRARWFLWDDARKRPVRFDTREWDLSHAPRKPRGYGSWVFSTLPDIHPDPATEVRVTRPGGGSNVIGDHYVWVNQARFVEAKRIAKEIARERGWDCLYVQP
jgi:hypothetical protein